MMNDKLTNNTTLQNSMLPLDKNIPNEWFVCPEEKTNLSLVNNKLVTQKNDVYEKDEKDNFWNFIPKNLKIFDKDRWASWNILQENGVTTYANDASKNLGVGPRKDFLDFAEFCNFYGLVLDIGVGPQKCPTHIQYNKKEKVFFIGIDPLKGDQPRDFAFVEGLGEYLPFKNELFDQVLFVTSLDHFIDPTVALKEAKRVMKKDAEMCIWLGEKDKNTPKPTVSPEWYQKLEIPRGAEDPFHFKRFSIEEFKSYLTLTGLTIKESKIIEVDKWRKNCFYKLIIQQ